MDLRYAAADGTPLYAVERGAGIPLVLLHGGMANHVACTRLADPLYARHRVIAPDVRANGESRYGGELSWDLLADDVAALLAHLGVARAVIGGISGGAGVAVRVALRHPAIVSALVVLMPAYGGADVGLTPFQAQAMAAIGACGARVPSEGVQAMLPLFAHAPPEIRARAPELVASYDPASIVATTRFLASGAQPFAAAAELAEIRVPALVVPGTDPTHPREIAERYAAHLPRCTLRDADPPGYAAVIDAFTQAL